MDKILEKIYSEKDLPTNLAIFVGAVSFLFVYIFFNKDPYLAFVALLITFSLTKVVSIGLIRRSKNKIHDDLKIKSYSDLEKDIISVYVNKGTCFLDIKDLRKGIYKIDEKGLDSLMVRGVIEFIDGSMQFLPTGFQLNEEIYKFFLQKKLIKDLQDF